MTDPLIDPSSHAAHTRLERVLLTLIGVGLGLALALVGTRFISSLLYSVSAIDPLTFAGVTLL